MSKTYTFIVDKEEVGLRIDQFLKTKLPMLTRSRIQKLIEEGFVTLKGLPLKGAKKTKEGMEISLVIPPEESITLTPEDIPMEILYEDEDLAVIYKPPGIVVHPAPGHPKGTLVHGLLSKLTNLSGIGGKLRPGIVHRLDKDTSGLMLIAKNDFTHQALVKAFKERAIQKEYIALVFGHLQPTEGKIDKPIGRHPKFRKKMAILSSGKEALTEYKVIKYLKKASLVLAKPITGRTHQIRVHFSSLGHPILGDSLYGGLKPDLPKAPRLMLHAIRLSFYHPREGKSLSFEKEPPQDFLEYLKLLEGA
ncbi:MAG: RluA family pseudouridine synthase [Caldimicrobium sp.]|nr:RluA family pseudouridine synthase [Caldimicrobium sp.]MCX7873791.1 RluA family pseudouridine synthase [Caldimicrobium sp.]MDW8094784.1 RluA family pseudouridine synthase [Caldimicrobium sp.]